MSRNNPADRIEHWPIDKLIPYARNARTHSEDQVAQLAASIKEWGLTSAILVDETGSIIAGHGRVMAARKLGIQALPVMVAAGWSDAQKRAYVIADNKLAMNAGWDNELLSLELKELDDLGFDLDLTGFLGEEIDALRPAELPPGPLADADAVPGLKEDAITRPGDVWVLDKHRLMCGDSTDAGSVALLMSGERAAMLVTSPPYWAKQEYDTTPGIEGMRDFMRRTAVAWSDVVIRRIVINTGNTQERGVVGEKKGRPAVRLCLDAEWVSAFDAAGWLLRHRRIWCKSGNLPHTGLDEDMCEQSWEAMMTFFRLGKNEGGQERTGEKWATEGIWLGIQGVGQNVVGDDHPCPFPVEIPARFIRLYSKPGDVIAEPFCGSGSTILAAHQAGRRCYAMELSPHYVDVAVRRWQGFTGLTAVRESDGAEFDFFDSPSSRAA